MKRILLISAFVVFAASARAASFDCAKAVSPDEHAVCANPQLSALDDLLPKAYAEAKKTTREENVPQIARDFLGDRRACGATRSCILSTYVAVLESYQDLGAKIAMPPGITALTISGEGAKPPTTLPRKLGQCAATRVTSIGPRLQAGEKAAPADFNSGTSVTFANDGYQVSYERETALLDSKPGDAVVMCLLSIPHHCPPNDERGRIYIVTNERTRQTWTLPDSQHSCGGA